MLGAGCQGEKLDETPVVARLNELVRFAGNADQGRFVEHVTLRGLALHHADWSFRRGQLMLSPTVSVAEASVLKAWITTNKDIATVCGTRMFISSRVDCMSLYGRLPVTLGTKPHRPGRSASNNWWMADLSTASPSGEIAVAVGS